MLPISGLLTGLPLTPSWRNRRVKSYGAVHSSSLTSQGSLTVAADPLRCTGALSTRVWMPTLPHYPLIVSGIPAPMRLAIHVMSLVLRRMQPCEAALPGRAREAVGAVECDLSRSSLELLKHVRPGAGGQREGIAGSGRGEGHGLLDEEESLRCRCGGLPHHGREPALDPSVLVHGHPARREIHRDAPGRGDASWCGARGSTPCAGWGGREAGRAASAGHRACEHGRARGALSARR